MKIAVFFPGIGYHCDKPLCTMQENWFRNMDMKRQSCRSIPIMAKIYAAIKRKCKRHLECLYVAGRKEA